MDLFSMYTITMFVFGKILLQQTLKTSQNNALIFIKSHRYFVEIEKNQSDIYRFQCFYFFP